MILIALGGAEGVWEEYKEAISLCPDADVGAVNDSGCDYSGRLSIWATLHPEKFHRWQEARSRKGFNTDYVACSNKRLDGVRIDFATNSVWGGSSGLFLCQLAAIKFRYSKIIVCGMPISEQPHYFDNQAWNGVSRYRRGWREAIQQPELNGKIRSMSGWTKEVLGSPTSDWLAVPE